MNDEGARQSPTASNAYRRRDRSTRSGENPIGHLLDEVGWFVRRFVVISESQRHAIALWIAHTHAIAAFDVTGYLGITSALKQSGKTLLLEIIGLLSRSQLPAANISVAALFRVIEDREPTLLLDEIDAIFSPKADREELRGILNAGYRRGGPGTVYRMGGAAKTTLQDFSVFCPKAFAGIGDLPDTISDRTIRIRLERRKRNGDEEIERYRIREQKVPAAELRDLLAELFEPEVDRLRDLRPELPDELDDRAQDIWEPLLAIADLAGGEWPERARVAALELSTGEAREDDSLSVQLLRDIYSVFSATGTRRYRTSDLLEELTQIEESPWADFDHGKPVTAHGLSRLLKPYGIRTMPVWVYGEAVRGYKAEQFEDTFVRVLGVSGVRAVRNESASHATPNAPNAPNAEEAWDNGPEFEPGWPPPPHSDDEVDRIGAEFAEQEERAA
jgi:hypothetical protein